MNVVQFVTSLDFGGAPRGVLELMHSLEQRGETVQRLLVLGRETRFPPDAPTPIRAPEYLDYNLRHFDFPGISRTVNRVRSVMRDHQADILHTHLPGADYIGALACAGTSCRHLSHIRALPEWQSLHTWRDRLRRWWYRRAFEQAQTRFVSVSQAAADYTSLEMGISPDRIRVVLNGVDPDRFPPLPETQGHSPTLRIGTAGRFSSEKGFADLIRAVAQLHGEFPQIELILAGQGGLQAEYQSLCRELGIADICHIVPPVDEMNGFLRGLDLFVLPSHSEGLARVIMEAMHCGTAIIATRAGGLKEAITHGETGWLYDPGDVPALVECLREAAGSEAKRRELGEAAARDAAQRFTVDRVAEEMAEVYRSLVAPESRTRKVSL